MRFCSVVGVLEVEPHELFRQQVIDPVFLEGVPFVKVVVGVIQVPFKVVVWRKDEAKRNKLVSQRIKTRTWKTARSTVALASR